jgi:hypothetical protein
MNKFKLTGETLNAELDPNYSLFAKPNPLTKLVIQSAEGGTLLDMDLATGECFVAMEDRMPEAAQQFWKHVRYLMGVK